MDYILVVSAQPDRVGIWEVHKAHPGGEVFVADRPELVSKTPRVALHLRRGMLREVGQNELTADDEARLSQLLVKVEEADLSPADEMRALFGPKVADILIEAGLASVDDVAETSDAELLDINGIAAATLKRIREALA